MLQKLQIPDWSHSGSGEAGRRQRLGRKGVLIRLMLAKGYALAAPTTATPPAGPLPVQVLLPAFTFTFLFGSISS